MDDRSSIMFFGTKTQEKQMTKNVEWGKNKDLGAAGKSLTHMIISD